MSIQSIAIIGGGTSGWLAANYLGETLSRRGNTSICLIESPDIPTIGVGEGTVPAMRTTLQRFGIRETDFIRECDASFKQSIKFTNWLDRHQHGENYYHHLFDYPYPLGDDLSEFWLASELEQTFADVVSFQGKICDAGLAPKKITTPEFQGDTSYAYHLNATKFAALLAKNAKQKFSVEHLRTNVVDLTLDENQIIKSLTTDTAGELDFDFYIDCTGFACWLLGQKLGVAFIDKSDQLFIDTALVAQVPTNAKDPIPPYTIATAHQAGWIWDIHLPHRRGVGLVYSSKHMADETAEQKFGYYLGAEAASSVDYRKIPMPVGRREQFWKGNCVAIGLSQGFAEPLEATALLLADYSARMLADKFPNQYSDMPVLANRFNKAMGYGWDRVFDFVKMHYHVSDRVDSAFWLDNKDPSTVSDNLSALLQIWRQHPPKAEDFFSKFEIFDVENYLYVLYGMKYKTHINKPSEGYMKISEKQVAQVSQHAKLLLKELPEHRALIDKIKSYGLQIV